jgi:hypothetical protein
VTDRPEATPGRPPGQAVEPDPLAARRAVIARLADEPWDVLVVDGGIVGSGVLLDATSGGSEIEACLASAHREYDVSGQGDPATDEVRA